MPWGLSCFEINWQKAGETAAAELAGLMAGKAEAGRQVLIGGELVARESSDRAAGSDGGDGREGSR
jgi:hypothetical protein